jgi:hypothetical protein
MSQYEEMIIGTDWGKFWRMLVMNYIKINVLGVLVWRVGLILGGLWDFLGGL